MGDDTADSTIKMIFCTDSVLSRAGDRAVSDRQPGQCRDRKTACDGKSGSRLKPTCRNWYGTVQVVKDQDV